MIEIKHQVNGEVLHTIEADSLTNADLTGANLTGANLTDASLYRANLYGAGLTGANLYGANLRDADLRGANLYGANLRDANLTGANLRGANLYGAGLTGANLYGANLTGANLTGANLTDANLTDANLTGANLTGANLTDANLTGAKGLPLPADHDPKALRAAVATHIESHPELHDQASWGDGSADPACGTPCCVAGWACHLGGGDRGLGVATAATLLLYAEGLPTPSFNAGATREEILEALKGEK